MMYYCQRLSCRLVILAEAASLQSQCFLLLTLHTVSNLLRTPLIPTKTVNFPRALVTMASSSKRGSYKFFFCLCHLYLSRSCCWPVGVLHTDSASIFCGGVRRCSSNYGAAFSQPSPTTPRLLRLPMGKVLVMSSPFAHPHGPLPPLALPQLAVIGFSTPSSSVEEDTESLAARHLLFPRTTTR